MRRWLFLGLVPLIPLLSQRAEERLGQTGTTQDVLYVWSGERLRRLAPGFENVLADVYWLRTVQYFGAQRAFSAEKRFDLLEPLIDITVTLDPRLEIAYRYGAVFLCEPWPTGKGDPRAGIAVLERGVRALPGSWRLREALGFFRYIFLSDARGGAEVLLEAARLPGAPFYLETLAASILNRGGERNTSRLIWRRLYDQAEVGFLRDNARYHLQRLDALDAIDVLNAAAERFRQRHGRRPSQPGELRAQGLSPGLFADATGVAFDYDATTGRFWFARHSRLWRSSP